MRERIDSITERIGQAMLGDQHRFRRALMRIEDALRGRGPGQDDVAADASLTRLASDVEASITRREQRRSGLPRPVFPGELPIVARREEIAKAISSHQVVVLCGETGSGKTTQLPKICLDLGRGIAGMIGHTQPRRIAARSVAARIAHELRTSLGSAVGYKVRFNDKTSPQNYIKVMTDGILLAETQQDRFLEAYDTIIVDEAHERSLNIDFLLGYLKQLLPKRRDLKVIITSATIDPQRFSRHFDDAPIIEVSGRTYPVEVRYRPHAPDDEETDHDVLGSIVSAVDELQAGAKGDTLIFLSGERDIRDTADALRKHFPSRSGVEVLPLYARLSTGEQNRVFQEHTNTRIVLATNVAETSITVPGIKYVIDPGTARISRYSTRSKVQRLPIEPISRASADQRKGRCGRVSEGICIRLYSEEDYLSRDAYTQPEILRTNLAGVILQMKALRLGRIEEFPFLESPDPRAIRDGYVTLHELGAVDERNELTPIGRELARLPIDPRIGRMILAAREEHALHEVLIIAAALSVQDPRERPLDRQQAADEAHAKFRDDSSDFLGYLKLWEAYHDEIRRGTRSQARKWCSQHFLSPVRMREWLDIHQQLLSLVREAGSEPNRRPAPPEHIHRALLTGLLGNIGLRGETSEYQGTRGSRFSIFPGSSLFRKTPRWVMAAEIVETTRLYARTVAPIHVEWIERLAPHLMKRSYSDPHWEKETVHVRAWERVTLHGLVVIPRRKVHFGPVDPRLAREIFIHHALVEGEYSSNAPYARHNRSLAAQVETLEAKQRRHDLLRDEKDVFAFYDRCIPRDVFSGPLFEQWRAKAERTQPRLLFMEMRDLVDHLPEGITTERFPDEIAVGQMRLPLQYRFEPGDPADGVTLSVPLAALNQLRPDPFEWLVPGWLDEKVTAMIKSLPKHLRVLFVPVPQTAASILPLLNHTSAQCHSSNAEKRNDTTVRSSLIDQLVIHLGQISGRAIRREDFNESGIEDYLRMNFRVLDDKGHPLAMSRDLTELQERLGAMAAGSFSGPAKDSDFTRDDLKKWDVGDLPERVSVRRAGVTMQGYPALVDKQTSVSLRLFDSADTARAVHRAGVRRLYLIALADEMKYLTRGLRGIDTLGVQFAPLGSVSALRAYLIELAIDRTFLENLPEVRTHMEFEVRLRERQHRIDESLRSTVALVTQILAAYQAVQIQLGGRIAPSWTAAINDVRQQLGRLMAEGFLLRIPYPWLEQYPRYLKAVQLRIQKLSNAGLDRDARHTADLSPLWQQYVARAELHRARGLYDPALEQYRWMLEEFRVSLFAQELGTAVPVSAKRLEQQWAMVK